MVRSISKKQALTAKMPTSKSIKKSSKKKSEIRSLYNQLNAVLPSFDNQDLVCGTDVVFKAVQYINQLHRRVANERGVEALQQIQNNARKIALQQLMEMKAQKLNKVSIKLKKYILTVEKVYVRHNFYNNFNFKI